MRNLKLNTKTLAFASVLLCAVLSSCNTELDGKYVKDADGNIYQAEWRIGRCYFLNKVDVSGIDSVRIK